MIVRCATLSNRTLVVENNHACGLACFFTRNIEVLGEISQPNIPTARNLDVPRHHHVSIKNTRSGVLTRSRDSLRACLSKYGNTFVASTKCRQAVATGTDRAYAVAAVADTADTRLGVADPKNTDTVQALRE